MLKLIQTGNQLPIQWPLAGEDTFEPGMIAQLKVVGNEVVCGVSDGTAPIGIIDDTRTTAYTSPVRDEIVIVSTTGVLQPDGTYISTVDSKEELAHASIIASSFRVDDGPQVTLNDVNGVITVPRSSTLNYDSDGDGIVDSFRVVVSYYYRVPEIPGDDSTVGTGRITVWFCRGMYETDQYDMSGQYYVNTVLYCGLDGKFTSRQPTANHAQVAICTGPPNSIAATIEFLWL